MDQKDKLMRKILTELKESPIRQIFQMLTESAAQSVLDGNKMEEIPTMADEDILELTLISARLKEMGLRYSAIALSAEISEKLHFDGISKLYSDYIPTNRLISQGSKRTTATVTREKLVFKNFVDKENWPLLLEEKLQKLRERNRELMAEWQKQNAVKKPVGPVEVPQEEEEEQSEDVSESSDDVPKPQMWGSWRYPTTPSELSTDAAGQITKKATPVESPPHRLSEIKASKLDDSQSAESDDSSTESASSSESESEKTVSEKDSDNKSVEEEFDAVDAGSDSDNSISF